ncbi:MAG: NRDE family protein [Planctomycetota bacterium]
MCVLILHHRTRPDASLVLLHNRDEDYDRAFDSPRLLEAGTGIVAPRDRQAGGTWIGVNRWGLVAAILNRTEEPPPDEVRSRGLLVFDALRAHSATSALEMLRTHLAHIAYAGFNLCLADGEKAFVIRHRGAPVPRPLTGDDVFEFFPGAYVLTNLHEPGSVPLPEAARPDPGEPLEATLDRLEALAGDASIRLPGGHRILKRSRRRGTVCSVLLAPPRMRFAPGPPDRTPFETIPLLVGARRPAAPDG